MFKVNNKDTRTYFTCCSSVSIVKFEHVNPDSIIVIFEEQFSVTNMYGWHGQGIYLFTMENIFVMYLSIVLDIVLGESSLKITLRSFVFYQFVVRVQDSILIDQQQNPSGYVPEKSPESCYIYKYWAKTIKIILCFSVLQYCLFRKKL